MGFTDYRRAVSCKLYEYKIKDGLLSSFSFMVATVLQITGLASVDYRPQARGLVWPRLRLVSKRSVANSEFPLNTRYLVLAER